MSWWGGGMVGRIYATQFYMAEIQSIPPAPNWPCGCTRPASAWRQANLSADAYQNLKPHTNFINSFVHTYYCDQKSPGTVGLYSVENCNWIVGYESSVTGSSLRSASTWPIRRSWAPVSSSSSSSDDKSGSHTLFFIERKILFKWVHVTKFTNSFSYSNPTVICIFCRNVSFWRNKHSFVVNRPRWF